MRTCKACKLSFEPQAEGQISCSFACARLMVARGHSRTRAATKVASTQADVPPGTKPRIAAALAETRANIWNLMRGRPS